MSKDCDASSIFKRSTHNVSVKLVGIGELLHEQKIVKIDLMKVNIEGGEYELLEFLVESSLICQIRDLQIQFHDFVPDAERRMHSIQRSLERTHRQTWSYQFVWEN